MVKVLVDVDYNKKNLERCKCISCPVQMDSVCANERKLKMLDMLANMKEGDLMPEPSHIAANYCVIGKASCGDLDTEEMCQCTQCPVFKENDLTTGYYCKLGKED
jgi:Protein of unknown function (DUF2769)